MSSVTHQAQKKYFESQTAQPVGHEDNQTGKTVPSPTDSVTDGATRDLARLQSLEEKFAAKHTEMELIESHVDADKVSQKAFIEGYLATLSQTNLEAYHKLYEEIRRCPDH